MAEVETSLPEHYVVEEVTSLPEHHVAELGTSFLQLHVAEIVISLPDHNVLGTLLYWPTCPDRDRMRTG